MRPPGCHPSTVFPILEIVMKFKLKSSLAVMLVLLVGCVSSVDDTTVAAQEVDLAQRLEQLEKRTELLETLLFSSVKLETKRAQRALEERQAILKHSKVLFAKGFINEIQLQQDQYRVEEAQLELELAVNPYNQRQQVCELNVIEAKRNLQNAEDQLAYQTLLAQKGYVTQTQLATMARSVNEATVALEFANSKLDAARKLDEITTVGMEPTAPAKTEPAKTELAAPQDGQEMELPKPGPEFDIFKSDVGTWDAEIIMSAGPGEPEITKGSETNRMLGGFWLLTDFKGKMMGLDFEGHGIYSYDAEKKQYTGIWMDSLSAQKMDMTGKYDKSTKTLTMEGMAPGPDGKPAKHVLSTKTHADGSRVMTMHIGEGESAFKMFEMKYTKRAKGAK